MSSKARVFNYGTLSRIETASAQRRASHDPRIASLSHTLT